MSAPGTATVDAEVLVASLLATHAMAVATQRQCEAALAALGVQSAPRPGVAQSPDEILGDASSGRPSVFGAARAEGS